MHAWVFSCFCNPPNSDVQYRICNTGSLTCERNHSDACVYYTRGLGTAYHAYIFNTGSCIHRHWVCDVTEVIVNQSGIWPETVVCIHAYFLRLRQMIWVNTVGLSVVHFVAAYVCDDAQATNDRALITNNCVDFVWFNNLNGWGQEHVIRISDTAGCFLFVLFFQSLWLYLLLQITSR